MDLVRQQSKLASAVVTVLIRICSNVFAIRRVNGELVIRRIR